MNQDALDSASHFLPDDSEPGQLRLGELLNSPTSHTQAALYKYIAGVAEQDRMRRQKLLTRELSSPAGSSSDVLDATSDRDELTGSGESKSVKTKQQAKRGKKAISSPEPAARTEAVAKSKVVKETLKKTIAKKRKAVIESDPEDDDESVAVESSNEGGEQADDVSTAKKPRTATTAPKGGRRGPRSGAKANYIPDAFSKGDEINLVESEEPRQEISIRIHDGYWLCHTQWTNGEWHIGLRRAFQNGGKQWMRLPGAAVKALLRAIPMLQERIENFAT